MTTTATQPTAETDLSRFCGYSTSKYYSAEPWVFGGWRYATDGRIVVRVPAPGKRNTKAVASDLPWPPAAELFKPTPRKSFAPWSGEFVPGITECWECASTGFVETAVCPTCNGGGCKKCNRHGYTGGRTCPVCDGRGELNGKGRRVGAHLIALKFDRLILSLPNPRYLQHADPCKPLPFSFDGGGEGLVMGRPE